MIKKIKDLFFQNKAQEKSMPSINNTAKIKVCVVDFSDNIESNNAMLLCNQLDNIDNLEIIFYKEPVNKTFLNLEAKHLFDFIDKGLDILYKTKADVLIWGIRENANSIRLHFQSEEMFASQSSSFMSILDSLYIPPCEDGFSTSVINLVYGAILSCFAPQKNELKIVKKYWLKKVIASLSKDNSAKELPLEYSPYIMNFLGLIYLSYAAYDINEKDYKIALSLFENALKHQDLINNPLHLGRIYIHIGQLNDIASSSNKVRPLKFFKNAIESYQFAQKYVNKYNFPYDYGYICYRLATLLFALFKQKNDTQSLRDSVFQLREAEKVFTFALFPDFWADLQAELGYRLAILGTITQSDEISELAISAYKNQQKVVTENTDAINWAKIQEKVGQIYYYLAKQKHDKSFLDAALECFHDSLYIFENANMQEEIKKINISILKSAKL